MPDLCRGVFLGDIGVRVVLGQCADAGEAVDDSRGFVTVDGTELEQAQRQIAVGTATGAVDEVVHRAIHGLEPVGSALLDYLAGLVADLVHGDRGEHVLAVVGQVSRGVVQGLFRDVRGTDVLEALVDVTGADVVLHLPFDDAALGVEDGQTGAELLGEGEQVHFGAELAVIATFGLGDAVLVGLEVVLRRPGGSVDALQTRIRLVAAPVGGRGSGDGEAVADEFGVGQVGAAAQVLPHDFSLAVDVLVDGEFAAADLDGGLFIGALALVTDELELVGLVRHACASLVLGDDDAVEGLSGLDDLGGFLLNRLEVFGGEGFSDIEVEVVAVGDVGPDAEFGSGEELLDGLCGDVAGGVAQDVESGIGVDGDRCDPVPCLQYATEVSGFAVQPHGNDRAVGGEDLRSGQPLFERNAFARAVNAFCH